MTKLANAGQATLPSGTGGVAINLGIAATAVIVVITGVAVAGSVGNQSHYSLGVVQGSTRFFRAVWARNDNANNAANLRIGDNGVGFFDAVVIEGSLSGSVLTLTPAASLSASATVTWYAMGGTTPEFALRATVFANGVTTTVNDCGFDPDFVIFGSGNNGTLNTSLNTGGGVALGAIVGTTRRAAGFALNPLGTTSCVATRHMTDRAVNTYAFSAWRTNTITVSLVSGGFSINNTDTQSGWTWALCGRGLNVALLSGALATAAGDLNLTGAGFDPSAALAFGIPDATADNTNGVATTSVFVGATVASGGQAAATVIHGFDTQRTGRDRVSNAAAIVTSEKTGVNTYVDDATATAAFIPDGVRYSFSTGHTVAGRFAVLVTDGELPASGPSLGAIEQYRRNQLLMVDR